MDREAAVILTQSKNVAMGIMLTLLFGGLGLFYASVAGGIIMTLIELGCGVVAFFTLGLGGFLLIPVHLICIIWVVIAVNSYNKELINRSNQRSTTSSPPQMAYMPSATSSDEISFTGNTTKKCPSCAETVKLEAKKCRFCGEIFNDEDIIQQQIQMKRAEMEEMRKSEEEKKKAGMIKCPTCGKWDVARGAYIEDGSTGDWCPHCKKSLQKMAGKI